MRHFRCDFGAYTKLISEFEQTLYKNVFRMDRESVTLLLEKGEVIHLHVTAMLAPRLPSEITARGAVQRDTTGSKTTS